MYSHQLCSVLEHGLNLLKTDTFEEVMVNSFVLSGTKCLRALIHAKKEQVGRNKSCFHNILK